MVQITIKMARIKSGLSQEEIAKELGTNRVTYAQYENYETPMRIDKALKFCEITDTKVDQVIFLDKNYTSSV